MVSSIQINSERIYFREFNKGKKTLLLIHGFAIESSIWKYVLPHLNNYRIICFDLVGYGLNANSGRNADIKSQARFLHDFIQSYGKIDCLIGYSFGGRVLYDYLKYYHEKTKKIMIVAVPFFPLQLSYKLISLFLRFFTINGLLAKFALYLGTTGPVYIRILMSWRITDLNNRRLIKETVNMIRSGNDPVKIIKCIADVFNSGPDGNIKYQGDLTYVYGNADGTATIAMANNKIIDDKIGKLFIIKKSGHLMPLEKPEKLAEIIKFVIK